MKYKGHLNCSQYCEHLNYVFGLFFDENAILHCFHITLIEKCLGAPQYHPLHIKPEYCQPRDPPLLTFE